MNYEKELTELKKENKDVFTLTAPLDDDGKTATVFLKKIDRETRNMVGKLAVTNDPLRAVESALKRLWIGGDPVDTILNNEDALLSCEDAVVEMMQKKTAVLKKN